MTNQQKTNATTALTALEKALKASKLAANLLGLLFTQAAFETAYFTHRLAVQYNNYSGIKYVAQKGTFKSPVKSPEGNYYASYLTPEDWAKDYLRILHKVNPEFGLSPLDAKGILGFARSLKANGYFTASLDSYATNLEAVKKWVRTNFKNVPFPQPILSQAMLFEVIVIFLAIIFLTDKISQNG